MYVTRPSCWRKNGCCYRVLNFARYLIITLAVVVILYFIVKSGLHVLDNSVLQLDKCPACFGIWEGVCQAISSGKLRVRENYFWNSESVKGVWYGVWDNSPVVVKQLGHGGELAMLDQEICLNTTEPVTKYCNVREKVWRSFLNPGLAFKRLPIVLFVHSVSCTSQWFVPCGILGIPGDLTATLGNLLKNGTKLSNPVISA